MLNTKAKNAKDSPLSHRILTFPVGGLDDVSDEEVGAFLPGYGFHVVEVQHHFRAVAGAVSYEVQIGGVSALEAAAEPVAGHGSPDLSATYDARRGDREALLTVLATVPAGGALEGTIHVVIRPLGLRGD